jgi:hypothetical protein
MADGRSVFGVVDNYRWFAAAGLGAAVACYLWWRRRPARQDGGVGAHAWLVPLGQARREAEWTRHALGHSSEAKHQ